MTALQKMVLPEYPCDAELLKKSALYKKSRELYLSGKGCFDLALVSSARSLSSSILLENRIEYTPLAREYAWVVENKQSWSALRPYMASLFHEQNHRVLWRFLPPAPRGAELVRRYLNFAEALIIVTDMALSDSLGTKAAAKYFALGMIYDPGTDIRSVVKTKRAYRNYLQACFYATYLRLEGFAPAAIQEIAHELYAPYVDAVVLKRAVQRSVNLNEGFVLNTNRIWQSRHLKLATKVLSKAKGIALTLDDDVLNNIEHYKIAERWFDLFRL